MNRIASVCLTFFISVHSAIAGPNLNQGNIPEPGWGCQCDQFGAALSYLGSLVFTAPSRRPVGRISEIKVLPDIGGDEPSSFWSYETYLLRVETGGGHVFTHPFKAAYGDFLVAVPEKLFGKRREYIVLVRATGKGTGVNTRVLEVWRLGDEGLRLVYHRTVADYVRIFPTEQWAYCAKLALIPTVDPLRADAGIELVLRQDPFGLSFYPKDRKGNLLPRYLCVAVAGDQLKEFPGETCYTAFWRKNLPPNEGGVQ